MAALALAQSPALRQAVEQNYVCRPAGFPHAPCTYANTCGNYAEACLWKKSKNGGRRNLQVACFGCATWMVGDQAQQCSLLTADLMRSLVGPPEAHGWTISDAADAFQVVTDWDAYKYSKPHTAGPGALPPMPAPLAPMPAPLEPLWECISYR